LEAVYENLPDIRESVRTKLERDREQAFFCQRMATLVCDMPLPATLEETKMENLPAKQILEFYEEMQFSLLTRRFREFLATPYATMAFDETDVPAKSEQTGDKATDQLALF